MPDPDPDPEPIPTVPLALDALAATSTCTALNSNEHVLGVSTEGYLWLATSTNSATNIRVLDGWDRSFEGSYTLPFTAIESARIWTATTASMIADRALWHVEDGERTAVTLPAMIGEHATLCGDPSRRAFVLSDGALFQRVDDEWFLWTGLDSAVMSDASLLARDGECEGESDRVWIVSGDVAFWSLTPASISNPALLEGGEQPALRGDDLLALKDGMLFIGPEPWANWAFEHGAARLLAAAGSYAWIVAGDRLLRFDGASFTDVASANAIVALHPHASGGLWFETADSICHVSPDPMLRVHGLRNGEERGRGELAFTAEATRSDLALTAKLDGVELAPSSAGNGSFSFSSTISVGWHQLELATDHAVRALSVKRLPEIERSFETDIRPIYNANCTGSACHISESTSHAPDFSRYEVWLQHAAQVHERIVVKQDMPPIAARGPSWSEDQVAIINEWLNGGLKP